MSILDRLNSSDNDISISSFYSNFRQWLYDLKDKNVEYSCSMYMGFPGSGKSTFAAYLAKKYLRAGWTVYSNVPIKGCYILDPAKEFGKYRLNKRSLVIIDEAGFDFDSRKFSSFSDHNKYGFKYHRHMYVDIVLFSQSDDIDKKIRDLCRCVYYMKKPWHYRLTKCFKRQLFIKKFDVDPITTEPRFLWSKVPWWGGGTKHIFGPAVWSMFDSYCLDELPTKEFKKYGDTN